MSRSYELKTGGGGGRGTVYPRPAHSHCWYEQPTVSQSNRSDCSFQASFDLPFCPSFKKLFDASPGEVDQAAAAVEEEEGTSDPALGGVETHRYLSRCLLPSATPLMDGECQVCHIEITPSVVVVYYGAMVDGGRRVGGHAGESKPLVGLAEYKIDLQTFSVKR